MSWSARILGGITLLCAARAHTQEPSEVGVKLAWVRGEGAEACPNGTALEADVQRRLGRNPFHEPVAQTLEGLVRRSAEGTWSAVLYDRDAAGTLVGTRELTSTGTTCDSLASAVALALALAIDPEAALGPAPAQPEAPAPAPLVHATELQAPSPPRPTAAPASARDSLDELRPAAGRVRLGALLSWQLVPGFAPGLALDVDGHAVGLLRWLVGMLYVPEQRSGDLGFGITAARMGACLIREHRRFSLGGCAAASLGAIHAVSYALAPVEPGDWFFGSADLSAEGSVVLFEPVFVSASLGFSVPFVRHRFQVEGHDSVEFQQPPLIPKGVLAVGVRFP